MILIYGNKITDSPEPSVFYNILFCVLRGKHAFMYLLLFQGITLKVDEEGRCIVARIMHGGMIHRQGR